MMSVNACVEKTFNSVVEYTIYFSALWSRYHKKFYPVVAFLFFACFWCKSKLVKCDKRFTLHTLPCVCACLFVNQCSVTLLDDKNKIISVCEALTTWNNLSGQGKKSGWPIFGFIPSLISQSVLNMNSAVSFLLSLEASLSWHPFTLLSLT